MNSTQKRNVLLIALPYLMELGKSKNVKLRTYKAFPYGLLSLATYAKKKAEEKLNVYVLDCNIYDDTDLNTLIKEKLNEIKPNIVGLSIMFDSSYKHLKDIAAIIREYNNDIIIVLGGASATASYEAILKEQENIDGICYFEGELPFFELATSENMLDYLQNDKTWITKKSLIEGRIPQKKLITDLDEILNLDYSLVDISSYGMTEGFSPFSGNKKEGNQFFIITSRGCPYKCVFCMHSSDNDKSMRYASVKEVIKHVKFLVTNYNMKILTIYDDQLLVNQKRAKKIFSELAQFNLRIECPNGLSVAFMDDELIKLMKNAGMDSVCLAIESGSPYVLNKLIHKPLKLEMVKPVVQSLRKHGFWIQGFFVSGIPGETDEHRDETVKFIKDVGLDWSGFSLATPSRGSELFKICTEKGYIKKDLGIDEIDPNKYIINAPEYTPDYITKKTYLMNLDVNFVNNYRMKIGDYRIAADSFKDVIRRYPFQAFAHFYLAKALSALNEDNEEILLAIENCQKIIDEDKTWKEYFEYFNINYRDF